MTSQGGARALRRGVRIPGLLALLGVGLLVVFVIFPWAGTRLREGLIALWSRVLLRACGMVLRERRAAGAERLSELRGQSGPGAGRMLMANHVSWLDVFAINSLAPASFAAKAEIAAWPLAGTLVARVGTVFVERGRRHAVHGVVQSLTQQLAHGRRVAVFPEGTTSDGQQLLPFHGNVVQAALNAAAPVVPLALRYLGPDGQPSQAALFVGEMSFLTSVWRITACARGVVEVHVLPHIELAPGMTRQALARAAQAAIAQCLGVPVLTLGPRGSGG